MPDHGNQAKWIEVNIHLINEKDTDGYIKSRISEIVQIAKTKYQILHWHFFREPEIRLRFLVLNEQAKGLVDYLTGELTADQTASTRVSHFIFGKHGKAGESYDGEADVWGDNWGIAMRMYEYQSELALAIIFFDTKDYRFLLHRYIHLFFDQLGIDHVHESALLSEFAQLAMAAHIKEIMS